MFVLPQNEKFWQCMPPLLHDYRIVLVVHGSKTGLQLLQFEEEEAVNNNKRQLSCIYEKFIDLRPEQEEGEDMFHDEDEWEYVADHSIAFRYPYVCVGGLPDDVSNRSQGIAAVYHFDTGDVSIDVSFHVGINR